MEKSETHRRDLSKAVEELMLICDSSEKELNKLVCVEQVSRWHLIVCTPETVPALEPSHAGHQDTMVENNVLKVEVKRVRDLLINQVDRMYSLEKRKLDLQRTIKEREQDIMVFRKMLSQQLKTSEEERQRLRFVFRSGSRTLVATFAESDCDQSCPSLELNEKLTEIKGMETHFEVMTSATAPPGGEEDRSQAYYITQVPSFDLEHRI